jgi:methionyl-tRNA formyltransferase
VKALKTSLFYGFTGVPRLPTNGGKKNILMLIFLCLEDITLRIIFMGSPQIAVPSLEQLITHGSNVVAVYTQPDRPAGRGGHLTASAIKETALKWGLEVVQPESLKPPEVLAKLASFEPDVIVVCAYGQILTQAVLELPPRQCINIHYSLLPRHRGASPVMAALLDGDEYTGVTIQLVRKKLDTGPLLAAAAIPISPIDNTGTLSAKLAVIGAHLMEEALTGWLRGEITPREQDESKATYFSQINKEAGEIDWTKPAVEIWRRVRAFQPWPGCYTAWKGKQLKINEALVSKEIRNEEPGTVISLGNLGVGITTGEGVLQVLAIQYEGKKAMNIKAFNHGQRDFVGSKLPS